ncbi:hypothetical protein [Schaalia sp. ZJ1691]|uniref:hypothetical protein n=1 Tax=Schaalia sp. ZJ1691 TaxID=2709404 RepID=UPI0013EC270F|nr:hypothetical protein [Schaalia sp. ZJ1691]
MTTTMNEDPRIFFKDTITYYVPESLSDLGGPESGYLDMPLTVYWGPDRHYPIHSDALRLSAYQEVLGNANVNQLCQLINEKNLRRLWKDLVLPTRLRKQWETKFPELADV